MGKSTQDDTQVSTQDDTQVQDKVYWMDKEQVIAEKIMEYCREPHSKKEIAEYLGYKTVKSIKAIMEKLLVEGNILMTNPDKPKSSKQRYITKLENLKSD